MVASIKIKKLNVVFLLFRKQVSSCFDSESGKAVDGGWGGGQQSTVVEKGDGECSV